MRDISLEKISGKALNNNLFLSSEQCKNLFEGKYIYVFGAGVDGESFGKALSDHINILAYVDNNKSGEGKRFQGKTIISLKQCLERRMKGQPILIASYRFAMEIIEQLEEIGLEPGADFYVWDDKCTFHYDSTIKEYIFFLDRLWGVYKKKGREGKVLVPFTNDYVLRGLTIYSYCANYFAEKYDATICAYCRYGQTVSGVSQVAADIYRAFNTEFIIDDSQMDEVQKKEADEICISIWNDLFTWQDWKNITVYGISFGTTIIRDFLRFHLPSFDLKGEKMYLFLQKTIKTIVFWYHYINESDIRVVLLQDGVSWEGYIRDIALTKGIPTYIVNSNKMAKATLNYCERPSYPHFKKMWEQLTQKEQQYGIKWAKQHIKDRMKGGTKDVKLLDKGNFSFAESKKSTRILNDNDKIKIIICPHVFEEDCYWYGEQIFDNNNFAWLCHLGELAEKTPDYEWYLKPHPSARGRDTLIMDMLLERFPQIKKIPSNVSPLQLKEEGAGFALTAYGTIGHEYPEIGIQVINAGINPHWAFDFNWNPKTKEEYDYLLMNLDKLDKRVNEEELCQFYSLNYLFYDWEYIPFRTFFFENPVLAMDRLELKAIDRKMGTWQYEEYIKEWTEERHNKILTELENVFQKLDEWRPDILYKRINCMDEKLGFLINEKYDMEE